MFAAVLSREAVRERLDGAQRNHPVDDAHGGGGGRIVDSQREAQPVAAHVLIERDSSLVAAASPRRLPPLLVGLDEVFLESRHADRESVLVAVVHLSPGVRACHLSREVLVRLGSESEVALVHELRVHLFGCLLGVAQLVVLHRRTAHTLDHRGYLSPRPQTGPPCA